jgi:hypothetical protein
MKAHLYTGGKPNKLRESWQKIKTEFLRSVAPQQKGEVPKTGDKQIKRSRKVTK